MPVGHRDTGPAGRVSVRLTVTRPFHRTATADRRPPVSAGFAPWSYNFDLMPKYIVASGFLTGVGAANPLRSLGAGPRMVPRYRRNPLQAAGGRGVNPLIRKPSANWHATC